ncbi:MAG: flagellar export chaperone FliS [Paenibacillaceae bacterium]|jgi:flagellar protein FliS|nr:flagellar export chaperone FliS [Paenibacillaceae bacterium]
MHELQRQKYVEHAVKTASQQQLLIMLVDGAIRFGKQAIEAIEARDMAQSHDRLMRMRDIVNEWVITIDRTSPIAANLLAIYEYLLYRIVQANMRKDRAIVEEVIQFLIELRDTWVQASRMLTKAAVHGNG